MVNTPQCEIIHVHIEWYYCYVILGACVSTSKQLVCETIYIATCAVVAIAYVLAIYDGRYNYIAR